MNFARVRLSRVRLPRVRLPRVRLPRVRLSMATPVLATKLFLPRPKGVHRSRLSTQLSEGLYRKLSLVIAPAGFGKTTLLGEWGAGCKRPVAWLSLDKAVAGQRGQRTCAFLDLPCRCVAGGWGKCRRGGAPRVSQLPAGYTSKARCPASANSRTPKGVRRSLGSR